MPQHRAPRLLVPPVEPEEDKRGVCRHCSKERCWASDRDVGTKSHFQTGQQSIRSGNDRVGNGDCGWRRLQRRHMKSFHANAEPDTGVLDTGLFCPAKWRGRSSCRARG